ncbi:Abi family protein [Orbaceae bacterium ESL0727]|nr:Abi family protein [Orbaceae bacterium ESL0727]
MQDNQSIKPHLNYEEQIKKLRSRGMDFSDLSQEQIIKKLSNVGYYRLSGYWYPFRKLKTPQPIDKIESKRLETFQSGTNFSEVYQCYLFDVKLRNILFYGIERIETYLKSVIAYELGKISPLSYLSKDIIARKFYHEHNIWLSKVYSLLARSKNSDCIDWNIHKYKDVPIWAIVDIWDFGTVSKLYGLLDDEYKFSICKALKFNQPNNSNIKTGLKSSLEQLNTIRNKCAHHARLWNIELNAIESLMFDNFDKNIIIFNKKSPELNKMAGIIYFIWSLTLRMSDHSDWLTLIIKHFENNPYIKFQQMGFPDGNLSTLYKLLESYQLAI